MDRESVFTKTLNEGFTKFRSQLRSGGRGEAWAPSSSRISIKGELGNHQNFTANIQQGEVEFAFRVRKNPQVSNL